MAIRRKRRTARPTPILALIGTKKRRRVELLGIEAVSALIIIAILLFFASGLQRLALRSPQVAAVVASALAELANGDRATNNLGLLRVNPVLVAAAQEKANDMATYGYFAHVSPDGTDPWHWFLKAGYKFDYAGENLAVDFSDSGDVERAWMNSPKHRENILDAKFTEVGIATAQGMYQGRMTTFVVQVFGTPAHASSNQEVQKAVIPDNPKEPATAENKLIAQRPASAAATQVLGTAKEEGGPIPAVSSAAPTSPALAAELAEDTSGNIPWWAYAVSFPSNTLRYAYYVIGLLVLAALAIDTGFELRWHHRKHALRAGAVLATLSVLFVVADNIFFAQPVLALIGA